MSFLVNTFFFYRLKSLIDIMCIFFSAKYCNSLFFFISIDQEEQASEKRVDLASPSDVTKVVFE